MIARYGIAIGIGAAVTFGLLFIMQLLIAMGAGGLNEDPNRRIMDFVRVERNEVVEHRERKPEKPPEPERPPEMPDNRNTDNFDTGLAVSMTAPTMNADLSVGTSGFGGDGEYLPMTRVAPVYPARAAQRGLEGYVIVEFTVTTDGTTKDIRVIESSSALFERSAVEAAAKFKYKPKVFNGEAVEVPGVRNQFTFVLTN